MIKSKTNKLGIKTVAIVLSFIMIVIVIPGTSAFAKGKNVSSDKGAIGTTDITEKNPEFVAELNEKRTLNEKHFLMDDGSITVAQYNQPVHFFDADGAMKDIDNSLVEITDTAILSGYGDPYGQLTIKSYTEIKATVSVFPFRLKAATAI